MTAFTIGDSVTYKTRTYVVRGISPKSVSPAVVYLVDLETGGPLEVPPEQLKLPTRDDRPGDQTDCRA